MTSSSSFDILLKDGKLIGSANWKPWKESIELILILKDLDECISPKPAKPAKDDKLYSTWKKGNGKAMVVIRMNCTDQPSTLITGVRSAREVWEKLQKQYEGFGMNLQQYLSQMNSIHYGQFTDVTSCIRSNSLMDFQLRSQSRLNANDPSFVANLKPQLQYLIEDITDEARTIEVSMGNTVMYAGRSKAQNNSQPRDQKVCDHCQKTSHIREKCWKLYPEMKEESKTR